jgi:hypothetical protein
MSVIQISKIQVRRGQKLLIGGIPQLSSAEFAWAVDTQELYIGNGSVSEGAPYVGNTKILTEHDNILSLANSYRYAATVPSITGSVSRSLQSKLDEIQVSITDFGAIPDGSTDCTEAFNTAFDQLFRNVDDKYKKVLFIPNGNYLISVTDLKIPSRATIRGENKLETVLHLGNNNIRFVSEIGTEVGAFTDYDYPKDIIVSNLTIDHNQGQTDITASKECVFDNVIWRSNYVLGDTVFVPENANGVYNIPIVTTGGNIQISGAGVTSPITVNFSGTYLSTLGSVVGILNADPTFFNFFEASVFGTSLKITALSSLAQTSTITGSFAIIGQIDNLTSPVTVTPILTDYTDGSQSVSASVFWNNQSFGLRTTDILFNNCVFKETRLGIECQQEDLFDTEIDFTNSKFFICDTGVYIGGVPPNLLENKHQGNNWNLKDCVFEEIAAQALVSTYGIGTKIFRTRFKNCGNGVGSSAVPITSIVRFGESINNVLIDCSSDRHQNSSIAKVANPNTPGVVEFEGASKASLVDRNYATVYAANEDRVLAAFPLANRFIIIDYFLSLGVNSLHKNSRVGQLIITVGDDLAGTDNVSNVALSDNYVYSPSLVSSPGGSQMTNFEFSVTLGDYDGDSNIETAVLRYRNPIDTGANGTISYSITYGV